MISGQFLAPDRVEHITDSGVPDRRQRAHVREDHPAPRRARRVDRYRRQRLFVVGGFLLAQVVIILFVNTRGATLDEGIYITAGLRTLDGFGLSDDYMSWFAGSLLWSALAGVAHHALGLMGVRLLAAILVTTGLALVGKAADNLYGARAGVWATAIGAASGAVLTLGHVGVYDAVAFVGLAAMMCALSEFFVRDRRAWIVIAAAAFVVAVLGKYPAVAAVSVVVSLIFIRRGRRGRIDVGMFIFVTGAALVVFYQMFEQQMLGLIEFRSEFEIPAFGFTREMIAVTLAYHVVPVALVTVVGVARSGRGSRATSLVLATSLALPIVYHLSTGSGVGQVKHLGLALTMALPVAGLGFAEIHRKMSAFVAVPALVALLALGLAQMRQEHNASPDPGPVANYLAQEAESADRLLIDTSWPYTLALMESGRIESPWSIYDTFRVENETLPVGICEFDWFVATPNGWPEDVTEAVHACGSFELVFSDTHELHGFTEEYHWITYPATSEVWERVSP